jgi:hypothetical protein
MERRFPQPVRVGDLIGLPILDYFDRTMARVLSVERSPTGGIQLVASYRKWFSSRPVAVPIEVVAIAGRQIASMDMSWADFDRAPTWTGTGAVKLSPDEKIRIGLYKR